MRILVTGADGFLGRGLVAALPNAYPDAERIVLTDRAFSATGSAAMEIVPGDLGDPDFIDRLVEPGFDLVFHLASIPGGLAESEQALGHRVNLIAPLGLANKVASQRPGATFVFASSIAVYGELGQKPVTVATGCRPLLTYGAHKLMTETLLSDMTRRGALSAVSLRFPGIVARPPTESGHGSAFMSKLFHAVRAGEAYDCPVPADSRCWWMSRAAAVRVLLHAAGRDHSWPSVIQPSVLHATIKDVADATSRVTGQASRVRFGSDLALQRIFGAMPALDAREATYLGFQADADLNMLATAALSGD
jgi:nucleoside-diphosphate-sugar epimerase